MTNPTLAKMLSSGAAKARGAQAEKLFAVAVAAHAGTKPINEKPAQGVKGSQEHDDRART
jgi:hypothetical protein